MGGIVQCRVYGTVGGWVGGTVHNAVGKVDTSVLKSCHRPTCRYYYSHQCCHNLFLILLSSYHHTTTLPPALFVLLEADVLVIVVIFSLSWTLIIIL